MEKVKVMIVEDDPMVTYIHKALLVKRDLCYDPLNFMNGVEALDFILDDSKKDKKALYLILLDINMPLMNGWEFLEAIQDCEVANRTEVIIVTSSPDPKDRCKAEELNLVTGYIEKPLINFDLVKKAKQHLEQRIE
ncbi:response regulator [Salinimicrobium catena]|uniref:response regulator n=1 Tax=Salinimicrobium catena TaxID=390640 RepID=UPI002FE4352A